MNCPHCKEPMIVVELNEVEIDYCHECAGIWLDAGELELLIEDSDEKEKMIKSFTQAKQSREKKYKCPRCRKKMEKVFVGEKEDVLIDRCRFGHGLWFDKGELPQIIEIGSGKEENKVISLLKDMFGE
jgi:Zn-finger nucleic acid-binding protein